MAKTSIPARILITIVRGYQLTLSPLLGRSCRFVPSCSAYCIEAIREHGTLKGLWMSFLRICKCHPFHPGGADFVPKRRAKREVL